MRIINLTQHVSTTEQLSAGVFEPDNKFEIRELLTFNVIPQGNDIKRKASLLADIAETNGATHAVIGGAPFFMSALENALLERDVQPIYAFSVRDSVEETMPDGSVVKRNIFRHAGFIGI
jgi:hypothetical protein